MRDRELREAHRRLVEMGASTHAERLAPEIADNEPLQRTGCAG
jgi:hypothetical protein